MIKHIVTFKLTGTPAERKEVANKFKECFDGSAPNYRRA